MASPKPAPSPVDALVEQSQRIIGMTPVIGNQADRLRDVRHDILADTERFARHWVERRHTATRTALETARDIARDGPADPLAAMRAIADWQLGSAGRISEDMRDWTDLWTRCARHVCRAEMDAGQAGLKTMADTAASTRRRKDDVPV